jgi:hypothetical protein
MKPDLNIPALVIAIAFLVGAPAARASDVTLLDTVGFIRGSQVFSDAINVTSAGRLTITLADVPWLDTLQSLNCFLSAPGGGIIGQAQNGLSEAVDVQPGTFYVNWFGQAAGPLSLGAYSLSVHLQPAALPVPLPPALLVLLSGLGSLATRLRRPRLRLAATAG